MADDELGLVGLDDDTARQRSGRLGPEPAQRVQPVVAVGIDVAGDEAGDEVLLGRARRSGGAVELARLLEGQPKEDGGGVGWGAAGQMVTWLFPSVHESPGLFAGLLIPVAGCAFLATLTFLFIMLCAFLIIRVFGLRVVESAGAGREVR